MGLDGILFYKLANELNYLSTGKIDKIQEVSDNEFLFSVRRERKNYKLLISLTPNYPRINLTTDAFSFPREPKSFTMLLRKYFEGAIIDSITTHQTDRVMTIATSRYDELGDFSRVNLVVEIMGRYSNLIVVENNIVIEALRHIGVSELRSVMPNSTYTFPDTLGKINPLNHTLLELRDILKKLNTPKDFNTKLLGVSYQTCLDAFKCEDPVKELYLLLNSNVPCVVNDPKKDISYYIKDNAKVYESYSALINDFYKEESLSDRIKSKTNNILSFVQKLIKKDENKIKKLKEEIEDTKKAELYKLYGELLIANSYINTKSDRITVLNYYTNENISIPLDKRLYIKENANLYFKKYRKSKNTVIHATEELTKANDEIEYFKLLESQIKHAEVIDDVLQIQDELIKEHYLIPQKKQIKLQKPKILTYELDENLIYVGKNNIQNEIVTYDLSRKEDLWFHVKDAPGSHVLLKKSDNYTEKDIRTCANIAACFSNLSASSSVAVNYTKIKYVKSIPGKKKCFVSLSHEKTIFIDPDFEEIKKLTKINK